MTSNKARTFKIHATQICKLIEITCIQVNVVYTTIGNYQHEKQLSKSKKKHFSDD